MTSPTLTAEELRVLACLIEKSHTTPDQYPMTSNALTAACNQKSSREPVVDFSSQLVDRTLQLLRDGGWARSGRSSGERSFKHRHIVDDRLGLGPAEQAVLAVLALRGPQSAGELKTRTERYHPFEDSAAVERVLTALAERPEPLTTNVGRGPGQSHDRWTQLLGPIPGDDAPPSPPPPVPGQASDSIQEVGPERTRSAETSPSTGASPDGESEIALLRQRVDELERRISFIEREFGLDQA